MTDSASSARSSSLDLVPFLLVVLSGYLLYLLTLQPVIGWGTGARVAHHSLALTLPESGDPHAVRILFGFLFDGLMNAVGTGGAEAWVQNLLSAICGAFALGLLYVIGRERGASRLAAALASFTLGFSHLYWHVSVTTGPYTVQVLLLLGVIYAVLRWRTDGSRVGWLLAAWFLVGTGLAETVYFWSFVPGLLLFYYLEPRTTSVRLRVLGVGSFVLGFVIGVGLPAVLAGAEGGTAYVPSFWNLMTPGVAPAGWWRSPSAFTTDLLRYAGALTYQFPLFGVLVGVGGAWADLRRDRSLFVLLIIPFLCLVLLTSPTRSAASFHQMILSFVLFALWIGSGMDVLVTYIYRRRAQMDTSIGAMNFSLVAIFVCSPFLLYFSVSGTENGDVFREIHPDRALGYRNDRAYFLEPWKMNDRSTEMLWNDVRDLPAGSIVVADRETAGPLLFYRTVRSKNTGRGTFELRDPGETAYRANPSKTVRNWLSSASGQDHEHTAHDPGVFLVGSHPVYQRERLEKGFHFVRRRGGGRRSSVGTAGGRGGGLSTVDHTGLLRLIPREGD